MLNTHLKRYSAIYSDRFGTENIVFESDGTTLFVKLRGTNFEGRDFELLEGNINYSKFDYIVFQDNSACLTNFNLKIVIPIVIVISEKEVVVDLIATIDSAKETNVHLCLETKFGIYQTEKKFGHFEDAMIDIQKKLPENFKLKTCLSCKYSHYNPFGNGIFGYLKCFKNYSKEVTKLNDKADLFNLWEKGVKENKIFDTQETFVCSDFKVIKKGDWVYKDWEVNL